MLNCKGEKTADISKFIHEIAKRLPRDGETEISVKEYGIEVYIAPGRYFAIRSSVQIPWLAQLATIHTSLPEII